MNHFKNCMIHCDQFQQTMSHRHFTSSLFIFFLVQTIVLGMHKMPPPEVKAYPGFGRQCSTDTDCIFNPKTSPGSIYLKCKPASDGNGGFCTCGSGSIPDKELMWPLEWDTVSQKCLVSKNALCGEHDGLQINCKSPFECLEGRCRNSSEIHSFQENKFCQDDLDCKEGLKCLESRVQTQVITRRCYRV